MCNGIVDVVVDSEVDVFEVVCKFLFYLLLFVYELLFVVFMIDDLVCKEEVLFFIVLIDGKMLYKLCKIIVVVVDMDSFFEIGE